MNHLRLHPKKKTWRVPTVIYPYFFVDIALLLHNKRIENQNAAKEEELKKWDELIEAKQLELDREVKQHKKYVRTNYSSGLLPCSRIF